MYSTLKYVENSTLDDITSLLTDLHQGVMVLNGRVETYSYKRKERSQSFDKLPIKVKEESSGRITTVSSVSSEFKQAAPSVFQPTLAPIPGSPRSPTPNPLGQLPATSSSSSSAFAGGAVAGVPVLTTSSSGNFTAVMAIATGGGTASTIVQRKEGSSSSSLNMRKPRANSMTERIEDSTSAKKLLKDLIQTLNESFPDYDFKDVKLNQFRSIDDHKIVTYDVDQKLADISQLTVAGGGFREKLWSTIEDIIDPTSRECEIYTYISDREGDPFSDNMWDFNYFFVNKERRQILYLTCLATSKYNTVNYSRDMSGESAADSQDDLNSDDCESPYCDQEESSDDDCVERYR